MALIKRIRDIKAAIRPKLKHVQLRVYIKGKQEQYPTKVRITEIDPKNMDVTEGRLHFYAGHLYGCAMHSDSAAQLREAYKHQIDQNIDAKTNYETSDLYIICDKYRNENSHELSNGYLRQYITLVSVLKTFKPGKVIKIQDITTEFITNFVFHLTNRKIVNGTVNKYLKNLKRIVQYAQYELNLITSNPRFPKPSTLKDNAHTIVALTMDEVHRLENVKISKPIEEKTLQHFLFMCYTGVRTSDLQHISYTNVTGNSLNFFIQKQQKTHTIPLDKKALDLLNKVKVFELLSQQKLNHYIKILTKRANITAQQTHYKSIGNQNPDQLKTPKNKLITGHTARRTWATLAYEYTNDIVLVSNRLGHKDTKTTLQYIGKTDVDDSKLDGLFSD